MKAQKREKQAEKRQKEQADATESKSTILKNKIMEIMSQMVTFQADEAKQNTTCFPRKKDRERNPIHVDLTEASTKSVEERRSKNRERVNRKKHTKRLKK